MKKNKSRTDIRKATYRSRINIGFPTKKELWQASPARFTAHSLVIDDHPVMEDWEDNYMEELARVAAKKGGKVLEVGFGMGISAGYIQKHDIEEHIIIEANRQVYGKLIEFAGEARRPVKPLFGFWQEVAGKIPDGLLSGILFDTYPLSEEEIHKNHFSFFGEAYRMLKPGGVLTYYSDEETDFSPEHREKLRQAGFTKIGKSVCRVNPPKDCLYWRSKTIIIPKIIK